LDGREVVCERVRTHSAAYSCTALLWQGRRRSGSLIGAHDGVFGGNGGRPAEARVRIRDNETAA